MLKKHSRYSTRSAKTAQLVPFFKQTTVCSMHTHSLGICHCMTVKKQQQKKPIKYVFLQEREAGYSKVTKVTKSKVT